MGDGRCGFVDALGACGAEDRLVLSGAAALVWPELAAGLPTLSAISTAIRIPMPITARMAATAAMRCLRGGSVES